MHQLGYFYHFSRGIASGLTKFGNSRDIAPTAFFKVIFVKQGFWRQILKSDRLVVNLR
jgi:hypothetical protein